MTDDQVGPEPGSTVPAPSAAFLLSVLGRQIRDRVDAALHSEGIAIRHVSALGHLSRSPGMSYSELGRRAAVTPQSVQATLNRLEEIGAVERVGGGGRGRSAQLFVTAEGRRLISMGMSAYAAVDDFLADSVGTGVVRDLLPSLAHALQALSDERDSTRDENGTSARFD